jgi:3-deoxy-D-manno-octulosonic-acid transferase
MYLLYSALLALGLLLSSPYWLWQSLRTGKYRKGFGERLGRVPKRLVREPARPVIWVHAVSVGEVLAISDLVQQLRRRHPEYRIVVSTTTDTGQKLAQTRLGQENVFYFPLDFAFAVRPYLRALKPKLIVIAETEFWMNFLRLAHESRAGIAVVNARISDRSWRGYRRWRRILKRALEPVDVFLAQTEEDGRRLVEIGAPPERVQVSGNLKFDVTLPDPPPLVSSLRQAFESTKTGPVLVCGSTVEGEESLLLAAFQSVRQRFPRAVMLLAPRHPERFSEVARRLQESGQPFVQRSLWNGEPLAGTVLLVDSIGELASLYALADLAFVGGSLVPRGGHNLLEPAAFGVAIVVGPYTENFRDVVLLFQRKNAVRVVRAAELSPVFIALLTDDAERMGLGLRAAETMRTQQGATQTTIHVVEGLLEKSAGPDL